ncbi:MAG: hypothetical protein QOD07_754 [Frankiaceae bacterium]|jgi:hypothetical protein|nr:hypothetical protein [Frankiaceae bacterium]
MSAMPVRRRLCAAVLAGAVLASLGACSGGSSAGRATTTTLSASARRARAARVAAARAAAAQRQKVALAAAAERRAAEVRRLDRRLFIMSDSVVLGSAAALPKALPTWKVNLDGKESRFFKAGLDVLRTRRSEIGRVVVIQMGNNYGGDPATFRGQIDEAMKILSGVQWVVFLTVYEYRHQQVEVNNELRAAAARYPQIRIADWNAYERLHPGHTSRDGLHLKPSGATLMADYIASVVNALPA